MGGEFTIAQIIQYAQISQYLAGNDKSSLTQLQSGSYIGILPQLLYMEGTLLQNLNTLNPGSPTLRGTAEYVLSLCGKYLTTAIQTVNNLAGSRPVVTGPANQSTTVGGSVTFSVSVTGTGPFSYQWLLGGVPIPGATSSTYPVTNAQLSQNGGLYSVAVTNSVTTVTSNQATLTVTASIQANWWFGSSDPYPALSGGSDTLVYQINQSIAHDAAITINYPSGAENNQFNVLRYPNTENQKTFWFNTSLNNGSIGDATMRNILNINGYYYIVSRAAMSLDNTTTTLTYS